MNIYNTLKNPNWWEADQLAINNYDRGVELGSTEKQLQLSGQSGTWTRDLRISSPAPWPLGHAASLKKEMAGHMRDKACQWQKFINKFMLCFWLLRALGSFYLVSLTVAGIRA